METMGNKETTNMGLTVIENTMKNIVHTLKNKIANNIVATTINNIMGTIMTIMTNLKLNLFGV